MKRDAEGASEMTGEPLRVGCVGAGFFSQFHIDAWSRIPGARLVAVADRDAATAEARLAAAPDGASGARAYASAEALLEREKPDLIDIVAPPAAHLEIIHLALDAGVRAIICQKPFCGELATARRAVAAAEAVGARIAVHENFRFQPWYRTLKRLIESGDLGRPLQLSFRLRPGDGRGASAYLDRQPYFREMPRFLIHETGVHWVDVFRFLFGDPTSVYADLRRLNPAIAGEDAGFFLMTFADDRRALFDGNRLVDHPAENHRRTMGECLVEGDEAAAALDGAGRVWRRALGARAWTETPVGAPSLGLGAGFGGDCVFALQSHVVAALRAGGPIENEAPDYLRVMEIEAAIYASAQSGRRVDL